MGLITSDRLIALKEAVKSECSRRSYTGSVSSYAGTSYDYTINPVSGGLILKEHYEKNAVPLNAILGTISVDGARIISEFELANYEAEVTRLSGISKTASDGGCNASCTGLCQTACSGTCKGTCSGSCSSSCTGGCRQTCSGSCTAVCAGSCSGGCSSTCTGSATGACSFCSNDTGGWGG